MRVQRVEGRAAPAGGRERTLRQVGRGLKGQLLTEDRTAGSEGLCGWEDRQQLKETQRLRTA